MKLQIAAASQKNPFSHLFLQHTLVILGIALASCTIVSNARAVFPFPDGGYPNNNTAEGTNALLSLGSGVNNTAIGFAALQNTGTANNNTATGASALSNDTTGGSNTATGSQALFLNGTGGNNTATGFQALFTNAGSNNTATGTSALFHNNSGVGNTASGSSALLNNQSGSGNTAVGDDALFNNTIGSSNIALGSKAGLNLTGSNNIDIGNPGLANESGTIRIGRAGTHTQTFIAGVTTANPSGASTLWVTPDGQLAVLASSARFKDEIKSMSDASDVLLGLRPVTFHYKKEIDPSGSPQFGLVAEEVERLNPALVTRDREGKAFTVRYEAVNAMLLNEFLKEHRTVEEQADSIAELQRMLAREEAVMAGQQKEISALTATIQKVSDRLDPSRPAPQTVLNNR
ncbi:MAG: tail fiber domain-containing protein [Chthoniobacterales bacterium]